MKKLILCGLLTTIIAIDAMEPEQRHSEHKFIKLISKKDGKYALIDQAILASVIGPTFMGMKEAQQAELPVNFGSRLFTLFEKALLLAKAFEGCPSNPANEQQIADSFSLVLQNPDLKNLFTNNLELASEALTMFDFFAGLPLGIRSAFNSHMQQIVNAHYLQGTLSLAAKELPGIDVGVSVNDLLKHKRLKSNAIQRLDDGNIIINLEDYNLNSTDGIQHIVRFDEHGKIIRVQLGHNKLTTLSIDFYLFFLSLINIQELRINDNELTVIPNWLFSGLPFKLRVFDLSNNQLATLPDLLQQNMHSDPFQLQELNLNGNKLTILPKYFLNNFPNIEILKLAHNKLTTDFPAIFYKEDTSLKTIMLSDNPINSATIHGFSPNIIKAIELGEAGEHISKAQQQAFKESDSKYNVGQE